MRYYLIAGEASGDMHGANLIREIKARDQSAEIRYWGGDNMKAQTGHAPVKHIKDLAFMGFVEVLLNIRTILRNLKLCKNDIEEFNPDIVVLIDYPGFNLKIAEFAHNKGFKVAYYISPQLWAWKAGRVKKIKAWVDEMICILPFEVDWYKQHGLEVSYVGHPLLDVVASFNHEADSGHPPVAIIPGSRKQEIKKMLPVMLKMSDAFPEERFVIAGAPAIDKSFYTPFISHYNNVELVFGQTHQVMHQAKAAMVTSGTATLETALFDTPEVVCYYGSAISFWLAKRLVKVKFISLVNLILDRELVKELIQQEFNHTNLATELHRLLEGDKRNNILQGYKELRNKLGDAGASGRAAAVIVGLVNA